MIHNKEEMYLDIKESKFKILITNKEDKTILSQEMNIDLNKDKNYEGITLKKIKNNEYGILYRGDIDMSFTMIILAIEGLLIIASLIGLLTKAKKLSLICGILAILFALLWYLVASGILTNCG